MSTDPKTSDAGYPKELEKYVRNVLELHKIRQSTKSEMALGLANNSNVEDDKKTESSLKMLKSHVKNVPDGSEQGVYYTLDWGGTNYRVLRISLLGRKDGYHSKQMIEQISDEYRKAKDAAMLFDYLAQKLKDFMIEEDKEKEKEKEKEKKENNNDDNAKDADKNENKDESKTNDDNSKIQIGFCFSFPMRQPALNSGILIQWTKGFTVPDVVDHDVSQLMNDAFKRLGMDNVEIDSMVNDTVGTLLACAYEHENTRLGVILGTGTNCAYVEPGADNEVINIEWGNFSSTLKENVLERVEIDCILDASTSNKGSYFAEKMISGKYLGELARLACVEVFKNKVTDEKDCSLNTAWKFEAKTVSDILRLQDKKDIDQLREFLNKECGLTKFTNEDSILMGQICEVLTYRAADTAAAMLSAVLEQTGVYCEDTQKENTFVLSQDYLDDKDKIVTVGVDGSVYNKDDFFRERLHNTLKLLVSDGIYERIKVVRSKDGSGKGAALAAACNQS